MTTLISEKMKTVTLKDLGKNRKFSSTESAIFDKMTKLGFPNRKTEAWRYLNLDTLLQTEFRSPSSKITLSSELRESIERHFIQSDVHSHLVFLNGVYEPALSSNYLPEGSFIKPISVVKTENPELLQDCYASKSTQDQSNVFAYLNELESQSAVVLYIREGVRIEESLHLIFASLDSEAAPFLYHPRMIVILEREASAKIVLNYLGFTEQKCLINSSVDLFLGERTNLNFVLLQRGSNHSQQFLNARAFLKESSNLKWISFAHDCGTTRNEARVYLEGAKASCSMQGLSLLENSTQVFHHASCLHQAPETRSTQLYKNILSGNSVAEFNSLAHVFREGQKANSYQLNRNLLLSEGARVYSRPQLKIYADDVQCSHGSATGQLEEDELFYLRSRGFSRESAKYMITYGFAEEVIAGIEPLSLRLQIERLVDHELQELTKNL